MGSSQSNKIQSNKIECMWLPAQSGKTRKCVERIKRRNCFEEEDLLGILELYCMRKQ